MDDIFISINKRKGVYEMPPMTEYEELANALALKLEMHRRQNGEAVAALLRSEKRFIMKKRQEEEKRLNDVDGFGVF